MVLKEPLTPRITRPLRVRLSDGTTVEVPDPMHLDPWIEQDEPLASDPHRFEQNLVYMMLRERFALPDYYVSFDRWLRMDPKDPSKQLQPDILVAIGVPHLDKNRYDPEGEGKPPAILMEWLSPSSFTADLDDKPKDYAALGVREYWLFNPAGEYAAPRMQAWHLARDGGRTPISTEPDGSLVSSVLPVCFAVLDDDLVVLDAKTREPLTFSEAARLRRIEAERLAREAERLAREAERLARDAERLAGEDRQRADEAEQRAQDADRRAVAAEQRGQEESAARRAAEAEIERLRGLLRQRELPEPER